MNNEQPYSNREMDEKIDGLHHRLEDVQKKLEESSNYQNEKLRSIESTGRATDTKVAIQNGRVGKLEAKSTWLAGVGVAVVFLFALISGLIVYSFQLSQDNLRQSILLEINK